MTSIRGPLLIALTLLCGTEGVTADPPTGPVSLWRELAARSAASLSLKAPPRGEAVRLASRSPSAVALPQAAAQVQRGAGGPYGHWIDTAAQRFTVPAPLIEAVIARESGGNPKARAGSTSAKGLMQTIDATFALAQRRLAARGIRIHDPLVPRDSILAGTWYLSHCFDLAAARSETALRRDRLGDWRKALEYYYAGPGLGRSSAPIVYVARRGKTVRIDKARYADAILTAAARGRRS